MKGNLLDGVERQTICKCADKHAFFTSRE